MSIQIMSTILGQRIKLVRPEKINKPIIHNSDLPKAKYNTRPKTIKEHSGKVVAVCIKLINGGIRSISPPATHLDVCEKMVINLDNVIQVGWKLDNGNYIWR